MPATLLRPAPGPDRPIRLMIVDDSLVARTVIARLIEPRREFALVGQAGNVAAALRLLDGRDVDIILLDVQMPGIDGITALPELIERSRGARVLVVSSAAGEGARATIEALTLGAADTLLKPAAGSFAGRFADDLIERLLRIGAAPRASAPRLSAVPVERPVAAPLGCIAIGASTGGLHALSGFLRALPPTVDAPILVTQHLPPTFMPYFAAQLQDIAGRPARVATEGARLEPGALLIAPGDGHLSLGRIGGEVRVKLDRAPAASGCLPSVDPMFAGVAAQFGATAVGVVLSGMGRDGALGAATLVAAGAEVLAQDPETSVVWGMPGAVANAGLAAAVLPPARLARRVTDRAGAQPWR